jgi:cyclomaltodextrinase / maltogenic alpha-amylase / neopullulanase
MFRLLVVLVVLITHVPEISAQTLSLRHHDSVVWSLDQVVRGTVQGASAGVLLVNNEPISFTATDGSFEVPVHLREQHTTIVACTSDGSACSNPVNWTLGYVPRPEVLLRAEVSGSTANLFIEVIDNPLGRSLTFDWSEDPDNPTLLGVTPSADSAASVSLEGAPVGEYYFNVDVDDGEGNIRRARTYLTVTEDSTHAFDISRDHAAWIHSATLYEIAPWYFARNCLDKFACIEDKLEEIAELGVTAIWLQPTFPTSGGGQAYDVTDYFGVWDVLGDEAGLRSLIAAAKALGLKVLFDFVPNHTSIEHPYAKDAIARGERSHYWDFYMREGDDAPYSNNYRQKAVGEMTFVYYFWEDLVTLNFDHEETRRHIIEAGRYWIEEFDIDGYRIDAVWAPHARNPEFMHEWRLAMKRVKPEVLLLAEDKAPRPDNFPSDFPSIFDNFDVAYDWTDRAYCISEWAWARYGQCNYFPDAYGHTGPKQTIFNHGLDRFKASTLRLGLTNRNRGYEEDARILRYMENNDTPRFIAHHTVEQTRMVAAMMFALPGVPMLYYGQESGITSTWPTIAAHRTIQSYDQHGLWPFYQHLLSLRVDLPVLYSDNFTEVPLAEQTPTGQVYAFRRWHDGQNVLAAVNLGAGGASVTMDLPADEMHFDFDASNGVYVTDLLTGDHRALQLSELATLEIDLPGHHTTLYVIADTVMQINVSSAPSAPVIASEFSLHPNYPNPFFGSTTVVYELPSASEVRMEVYDMLGRRVLATEAGIQPSGRHEAQLDASQLASGLYMLRVWSNGQSRTRQLTVIR